MEVEIKALENLSLQPDEADYLRKLGLGFEESYLRFLSNKPMEGCFVRYVHQESIKFTDNDYVPEVHGEWCRAMLYEIFCLSIANEIFARQYCRFNNVKYDWLTEAGEVRLAKKIAYLQEHKAGNYCKHPMSISEFGTRRRLSHAWQAHVVKELYSSGVINATSNVYFGKLFDIPVRGTFGHEFTMGMQALTRVQDSQKEALWLWHREWNGKLSLALDDTLGDAKFVQDFDKDLAMAYSGLRHDSGEPEAWTEDRITMYHRLDVNPEQKTLLYSDGLDVHKAVALRNLVGLRAIPKFGIGTNFTNDTFSPVPQVVMKIVHCNGQHVAKLSNNPAKACCDDPEYLRYIKHISGVKDSA